MNPLEIRSLRLQLGLTQARLAELVGVHPITVCRWETGDLVPPAYQMQLLEGFRGAAAKTPAIDQGIGKALVAGGLLAGIAYLLNAALEPDPPRRTRARGSGRKRPKKR